MQDPPVSVVPSKITYRTTNRTLHILLELGHVVLIWGAVAFMIFAAVFLVITKDRLKELDDHVHSIIKNVNTTSGVANALMGKVYASYDRTNEVTDAALGTVKQLDETLARLDLELFGAKRTRPANPPALMGMLRLLLEDIDKDAFAVTGATVDLMKTYGFAGEKLNLAAGELNSTLMEVRRQLNANGNLTQQTISDLDRTIKTLDKQLDEIGSGISRNLANTEKATDHMAEGMKSIDVALRPLRTASGKLKTILKTAAGFFRVTIPMW